MRFTQAHKIKVKYTQRIHDVYQSTIQYHRSADEHHQEFKEAILDKQDYLNAPSWVRQYLAGVSDTLWQELWTHLEYITIGPDGKIYHTNDHSWLHQDIQYQIRMFSRHVWKDALPDYRFF